MLQHQMLSKTTKLVFKGLRPFDLISSFRALTISCMYSSNWRTLNWQDAAADDTMNPIPKISATSLYEMTSLYSLDGSPEAACGPDIIETSFSLSHLTFYGRCSLVRLGLRVLSNEFVTCRGLIRQQLVVKCLIAKIINRLEKEMKPQV